MMMFGEDDCVTRLGNGVLRTVQDHGGLKPSGSYTGEVTVF